jgi:hypothetical protein
MPREKTLVRSEEEVNSWHMPPEDTIKPVHRPRFRAKCAALRAISLGETNLSEAATSMQLCRKQLRSMVDRAPCMAPDGQPNGFRVCVPWGTYCKAEHVADAEMPRVAGPHALGAMLAAQPHIAAWIHGYSTPLPPGRAPRNFDRLHTRVVAELKRLDLHDYYPLNQPDKGKRALRRYICNRRIETAPMPGMEALDIAAPTRLADLFRGQPFDRMELDGHRLDIEAPLQVSSPNGGCVTRPITSLWVIPEIECESRAIVSWVLRVGRNYNNQDVTQTMANSMRPWLARDLTIPDLAYAHGAGMPSSIPGPMGFCRGRMIALDNHKGHHAHSLEDAYCRAHDGILTLGKPHQPRGRPIIEQFNSRIEKGAIRLLPGGFEPATKLGDDKLRISEFDPEKHPIQLHRLEELIDVIVANYNATPHPSLGDLSPLQYLQQSAMRDLWFYQPSDGEACAEDMNSVVVALRVNGNKKTGEMPHVNYAYVRYRSQELDNAWELVGKTLTARVSRHDLRSLTLYRSATKPIGVLRAASPWSHTRHDETTRKLIFQWSKQKGGLSLRGVECAVTAYVNFLRKAANASQQAVDQLARIQQNHPRPITPPSQRSVMSTPLRAPIRGWISMDDIRDA